MQKVFIQGICILYIIYILVLIPGISNQTLGFNSEYQANYLINEDWNRILDVFVEIEAQSNIGNDINEDVFSELNQLFRTVFPYLPQQQNFKIVYEQCALLSNELADDFTSNRFSNFVDNCQTRLNRVIKDINTNYTIKPSVKVSPDKGSAPHTVTLDARSSTDPSKQTIPSQNFFRWYKDTDGVDREIGRGSVVNYTFEKEGNYYVHVTIRSANNQEGGILDGTETFNINVSPQAAIVVVYMDGQQMDERRHTKVGSTEARQGVTFDGSATTPQGGRQILEHQRMITSNQGFSYESRKNKGLPGSIVVPLPNNGEYTVTLITKDNENNEMRKNFLAKVSDPIAIIEQKPSAGNTSTEFIFNATKSYSIQSRIRLYTRDVFGPDGERIYTAQQEEIKRKFTKPGPYNIKLAVTDETGDVDEETITVNVGSTPPLAQFSFTPVADRSRPSQFIFDASKTTDIDVSNGFDTIKYERIFSDSTNVVIDREEQNKKIIVASFNKPGTFEVTLVATDGFGERSEETKTVIVESGLRPIILASPKADNRGKPITFVVNTNNDTVVNYEWDFGDNQTRQTQSNTIKYTYNRIGVYKVSVTASTKNGDFNTVTTQVFMGEKDQPIAAYQIMDRMNNIMQQRDVCVIDEDGTQKDEPAYKVDRYQDIRFDMAESVNVQGTKQNLKFFYQPQDDEIYTRANFSYKFNDIGCKYVDVTVEDTNAGKNARHRIWFKVYNALPTLENILLSFPQYGNEIGIGFQQDQARDILSNKFDPLIVKVDAQNSFDPDGFISYYTWYYYDKNNPDRILESRVTPASVAYTYFSLPTTVPGEYVFGVKMNDNDGGAIASEELIGFSASIPFFPDSKNLDIPIVNVIPDRINIKAGDEVTFTVKSRILSERQDFEAKRTIRYDFNGDGKIDLTTKDDVVTYVYREPNEEGVVPKVEVLYRGFKGTSFSEKITVSDGLKPILMYSIVDRTLLVRDASIGSISDKRMCFDRNKCKEDEKFIINEGNTFIFTYPDYGQYVTEYTIKDDFGNIATDRQVITIERPEKRPNIEIATLPKIEETEGQKIIRLGENMANSLLMYVSYNDSDGGDCFIDIDISYDSDSDGVIDNDRDLECNTPSGLIRYNPGFSEVVGRIYYDLPIGEEGTSKTSTETLTIQFLDFESTLSEQEQEYYDRLGNIIKVIDPTKGTNRELANELLYMRNNIQSSVDIANSIIIINDLLTNNQEIEIDPITRSNLDSILKDLSSGSVIAAMGGNDFQQGKQEIMSILPSGLKNEIEGYFVQIEQLENTENNKDQIKSILDTIVQRVISSAVLTIDQQTDNNILQEDIDLIIMPNICKILTYYEISSNRCSNGNDLSANVIAESTSSGMGTILKIILVIVGIVAIVFIGIIVYFAIKAKQENTSTSNT